MMIPQNNKRSNHNNKKRPYSSISGFNNSGPGTIIAGDNAFDLHNNNNNNNNSHNTASNPNIPIRTNNNNTSTPSRIGSSTGGCDDDDGNQTDEGWTTAHTPFRKRIEALGTPQPLEKCFGCSVESTQADSTQNIINTTALHCFISIVNSTSHMVLEARSRYIHLAYNIIIREPINNRINLQKQKLMIDMNNAKTETEKKRINRQINKLKHMDDWTVPTICQHFMEHIATPATKLAMVADELITCVSTSVSNNLCEVHPSYKYSNGDPMTRLNYQQLRTIASAMKTCSEVVKTQQYHNNTGIKSIRGPVMSSSEAPVSIQGGGILDLEGYNIAQYGSDNKSVTNYLFSQRDPLSSTIPTPQYIKTASGSVNVYLPPGQPVRTTTINLTNKTVHKHRYVNKI